MRDITKAELIFEIESLQQKPDIDVDAVWKLLDRVGMIEAEATRIPMYSVARQTFKGRVIQDLICQHRAMSMRKHLEAAQN